MAKGKGDEFWDSEKQIKVIKKNQKENVVITECVKKEKVWINVRIWYYSPEEDKYLPSAKGICLPKDTFEEVYDTLKDYFELATLLN